MTAANQNGDVDARTLRQRMLSAIFGAEQAEGDRVWWDADGDAEGAVGDGRCYGIVVDEAPDTDAEGDVVRVAVYQPNDAGDEWEATGSTEVLEALTDGD